MFYGSFRASSELLNMGSAGRPSQQFYTSSRFIRKSLADQGHYGAMDTEEIDAVRKPRDGRVTTGAPHLQI